MSNIAQVSPEDRDLLPVYLKKRRNHKTPEGGAYYEVVYSRSGKEYKLHRIVAGRIAGRDLLPTECVDHINGDTVDCRRENLRVTTSLQNRANTRSYVGVSKYKGVWYDPKRRGHKKWIAQMGLVFGVKRYGRINLGRFHTEIEAAEAYNATAREWYGPYARLNEVTYVNKD